MNPIWKRGIVAAAGGIPFPAISGLALRLATSGHYEDDAATTPANDTGAPVGYWQDLSGNGYHPTETGGNRPKLIRSDLAGRRAVFFDGTDYLTIPAGFGIGTKSFTSFAVHRLHNFINLQMMFGVTTLGHYSSQGILTAFIGNAQVSSGLRVPMNYAYSIVASGASNVRFYIDGRTATVAGGSSASLTGGRVGEFGNGLHRLTNGAIRELAIYNRQLTAGEIGELIAYAAARYGVATVAPTKQLFFHGNSLTFGTGSTLYQSYPHRAMRILGNAWTSRQSAESGKSTPTMITDGAAVDTAYSISLYAKNAIAGWEGTNHLNVTDPTTAYNSLVTYYQARQTTGWDVIAMTVLNRTGSGTKVGFEADRQTLNTSLRNNAGTFCDVLVDLDTDARLTDSTNTTYFTDGIHLTDAGYQVVAEMVAAAAAAL